MDVRALRRIVSGSAEILGGLALTLPAVTGILPELTAWAAVGLILVMVGAVIWHGSRGEGTQIVLNLVSAAVLALVAYGRARLQPPPRGMSGARPRLHTAQCL